MSSTDSGTGSNRSIRSWRSSFLTLRDEALMPHPPIVVLCLLRDLIAPPHSLDVLVSAAPHLPYHEVTSDLMLVMELVSSVLDCPEVNDIFVHVSRLIHNIISKGCFEVNASSFAITLDFLNNMVTCLLGEVDAREVFLRDLIGMQSLVEIMGILRFFVKVYERKISSLERTRLAKLLLDIISLFPADLLMLSHSDSTYWNPSDVGNKNSKSHILLDIQLFTFVTISDTFTKMGSTISEDIWKYALDVMRKVMDIIAFKNSLLEGHAISRFYTVLLHCLHLVLSNPKGSISEHVAGFLAALQMFFMYGLPCRSFLRPAISNLKNEKSSSSSLKSELINTTKIMDVPYRPPHLRKKEKCSSHSPISQDGAFISGFTSSDSEQSDSDGFSYDKDYFRSSKARVAAIICIQDICKADPKSLASLWTMVLPTSEVLQPRKSQATVMTTLLFDHVMKARIASVSTLISILDGHSSVFLQVAEYKESAKCGSFTTLSSSLGQILMQLHRGLLYLVQYEGNSGLLPSLFKVLTLVVSVTPYSRMPGDLLPTVLTSLRERIAIMVASTSDQMNAMPNVFSCVCSIFSTSPPSLHVLKLLEEELLTGAFHNQGRSSILHFLIHFSQSNSHSIIKFEALQALRAVPHNYPSLIDTLWEQISASMLQSLHMFIPIGPVCEDSTYREKGDNRMFGSCNDKCAVASIKVLDECLRASSGFKGMDDHIESRILDAQSVLDLTRRKNISCAPLSELNDQKISNGCSTSCSNGTRHWSEVIEKHLPLILQHDFPTVRAASVTCFAGMTASVFLSLTDAEQKFIKLSILTAASNDEVPSVRASACRALGVVASFPQIFSSVGVLNEFINAAILNVHSPLVSVRITSSWALANICDSLRYRATDSNMSMYNDDVVTSASISLLVESSLWLTRDGDKIKSNAVRALGNLSRFVAFTDHSISSNGHGNSCTLIGTPHWLERMVQAFVSSVTTGNVKVQWNVCHALGNLFLNNTLKLRDMPWASSVYTILLLLLRDSMNYKIRINAAVALSVPSSRLDYGDSFPDVVKGLGLILESLNLDHSSVPSNFKYKDTLQKQLALTTLHVLGFASTEDDILKGFLVRKATFLEEWLKSLSSLLTSKDKSNYEVNLEANQSNESDSYQVKKLIYKALRALIEAYEYSDKPSIAVRFEKLLDHFS